MKTLNASMEIHAPIEVVFNAFSDFSTAGLVLRQAENITFVSQNTRGLGTEWKETKTTGVGTNQESNHKVTHFEKHWLLEVFSEDSKTSDTSIFQFSESGHWTNVTMTMHMNPKTASAKIALLLLPRLARTILHEDLTRMKCYIENLSMTEESEQIY